MDSGCVPLEFASYDEGCQTMESGDLWGDEEAGGEAAPPMPHVLPTLGREPGWGNTSAAAAGAAASNNYRRSSCDSDSDSDSAEECEEEEEESDHSDDLDADEDWCLEQIENAYENLARAELGGANNSLSQYEMRQGLAEVRTVYRTLCRELGEAPRDGDGDGVSWEAKSTKQALLDYKVLVYPALRLRREREETVVKLCKQITELLSSLASGVSSPLFLEVMKVAEYDAEGHVGNAASGSAGGGGGGAAATAATSTADACAAGDPQAGEKKAKKKKGAPRRGSGPSAVAVPRSLLPKDLSVVSVHSKSISLFRALLERMTEAKSKAKTTAPVDAASPAPPAADAAATTTAATAAAATCVAIPRKRTTGETVADVVATAGCVKTLWDEDLLPVMKTLRITDTTWGQRMREVMVAGCQDDESDDDDSPLSAPAVLRAARESLAAAVPLHAEVTTLLKSVSQEKATLECLVELRPQSRKRRRNPTERQANEALELARLKERVHTCATEALAKLRAFGCDTRGVPYVPPQILTTLVGLPSDEGGLVQYLQAVCDEAAPDGAAAAQPQQQTPQQPSRSFGDCSASI